MIDHMIPLYILPPDVEARWINPENILGKKGAGGMVDGGRKGSPCYGALAAGATITLADFSGHSGIIRHLWTTINDRSPKFLRGLRLDFFWDGETQPAISAPYGDFFGIGLGRIIASGNAIFDCPEGRNYNSFVPMPFRKGFRITVTNETGEDLRMFWFQADFTINDPIPEPLLYLHAYFHRQQSIRMQDDYEFLPHVTGAGRYLGVNFGVITNKEYLRTWWGEGEVKIYLDGDTDYPTLCGTGTEDYICTSWGQGKYSMPYYGCTLAEDTTGSYCFYRYHVPDPIYFRKEIRATIQQIGCWDPKSIVEFHQTGFQLLHNGPERRPVNMELEAAAARYGIFEREGDDWSSCAYFYLDRPTHDLPPLLPFAERNAGLEDITKDQRSDAMFT